MRLTIRRFALVPLVGCFLVMWSTHSEREFIEAQQRAPIVVTRLYTGPDGQSHFEDISEKMMPGGRSSEIGKATGYALSHSSPQGVNDWHTAPRRQFVIQLSGVREVEIAGGQKMRLEPGSILLAEDVTGKGHITRRIGPEENVFLAVHLD